MTTQPAGMAPLSTEKKTFYCHVMELLEAAGIPFLVGGTYAWGHYTGAERTTKDFDLFLKESDLPQARAIFETAGYRTELPFTHWIAKVYDGDCFVDLIFNSGNGICAVDDQWFRFAQPGQLFGKPVLLCPVEEIIWQKSFIMERERYDGGDVAHLLRARGDQLDWWRLLCRFNDNWRVLLSHLILFGFIYPSERNKVPLEVLQKLLNRFYRDLQPGSPIEPTCRGPLLSRAQYVIDVEHWGYQDPRIEPSGPLTEQQLAEWNQAMVADTHVVIPFPSFSPDVESARPAEEPNRSTA